MVDSTVGRVRRALAGHGRREVATVLVVAALLVGAHLLAPALVPAYAVYVQYATYLVVFSVWMAWFVDWLAVRLGTEAHPSERNRNL